MSIKTKEKLFASLDRYFHSDDFAKKGINNKIIDVIQSGDETLILVDVASLGIRLQVEHFLEKAGFNVHKDYCIGYGIVTVGVKQFKFKKVGNNYVVKI